MRQLSRACETNESILNEEEIKESVVDVVAALSGRKDRFELYGTIFNNSKEIMELFFKRFFMYTEGWSCSADKARFTTRQILKAFETKEHLPLQETYDPNVHWQAKECAGEIAYWCPEKIKDTKEAIELFWNMITLNFESILKYFEAEGELDD